MALTDIEVTMRPDGAPTLAFSARQRSRGAELNLVDYSLSFTHDGKYAAAVLVAVGGEPPKPISDKVPHPSRAQELKVTERTDSIRNILTKHGRLSMPVEELKDDTSLYGAGLTSHPTVNVMLALESEFDTELPANLLRRSTFESIENLDLALQDVLGLKGDAGQRSQGRAESGRRRAAWRLLNWSGVRRRVRRLTRSTATHAFRTRQSMRFRAAGLLGALVPASYGGKGGTYADITAMCTALGQVLLVGGDGLCNAPVSRSRASSSTVRAVPTSMTSCTRSPRKDA